MNEEKELQAEETVVEENKEQTKEKSRSKSKKLQEEYDL
jgi:hypothetical protein